MNCKTISPLSLVLSSLFFFSSSSNATTESSSSHIPFYVQQQLPDNAIVLFTDAFIDAAGVENAKVTYQVYNSVITSLFKGAETLGAGKSTISKGPIPSWFAKTIDDASDDQVFDIDIFVEDEVGKELSTKPHSIQLSFPSRASGMVELNGQPASYEDLRLLHVQMQDGIFKGHASREARRENRLKALATKLSFTYKKDKNEWLRQKLTKVGLKRLIKDCGELCASIEPHIETTANVTLDDVDATIGTKLYAKPYGYIGNNVGVLVRDSGSINLNKTYTDSSGNQVNLFDASKIEVYDGRPVDVHTEYVVAALQYVSPGSGINIVNAYQYNCYIYADFPYLAPTIYVYNNSWGYVDGGSNIYNNCSRTWDNFVYNNRILTIFSAGNLDQTGGYNVATPAKGSNILAIGNYNSTNQSIDSDSCYLNPETGMEKPELVAPGVSITIGNDLTGGTSISAPFSSGFAADFISHNISALGYRPELVKAYLIAGASIAINGGADKSGNGGISYLDTQHDSWGWGWHGNNGDHFNSSNIIEVPFLFYAGHRYRAAISWLTPGDYVFANKKPSMDLDLHVFWGDALKAYSTSASNTYELIDFVPANTGYHTIKIHRYSNSGTGLIALGMSVSKI